MALTTSVDFQFRADQSNTVDRFAGQGTTSFPFSLRFGDGVAINQANLIWSGKRTLIASATEDLDLSGILTPPGGGSAVAFARIKGLIVFALAANTNNVNVLRPASNGVPLFLTPSAGIPVVPGGAFIWLAPTAAGIVVTASTGDLITVTNAGGGTPVTYEVAILGGAT